MTDHSGLSDAIAWAALEDFNVIFISPFRCSHKSPDMHFFFQFCHPRSKCKNEKVLGGSSKQRHRTLLWPREPKRPLHMFKCVQNITHYIFGVHAPKFSKQMIHGGYSLSSQARTHGRWKSRLFGFFPKKLPRAPIVLSLRLWEGKCKHYLRVEVALRGCQKEWKNSNGLYVLQLFYWCAFMM